MTIPSCGDSGWKEITDPSQLYFENANGTKTYFGSWYGISGQTLMNQQGTSTNAYRAKKYETCNTADGTQLLKASLETSKGNPITDTMAFMRGTLRHYLSSTTPEAVYLVGTSKIGTGLWSGTSNSAIGEVAGHHWSTAGSMVNYQLDTTAVIDTIGYSSGMVQLDANGGAFSDGTTVKWISASDDITDLDGVPFPSLDGKDISGWTMNGKPAVEGHFTTGTILKAEWVETKGKPKSVDIECTASSDTKRLCSVTARYVNKPSSTVRLYTTDTSLKYAGNAIPGVVLTDQGYDTDASCVQFGSGNAYATCYYASLAEAPADNGGNTYVQAPTTGAPVGLSQIGIIAIGLGLLAGSITLIKRRA